MEPVIIQSKTKETKVNSNLVQGRFEPPLQANDQQGGPELARQPRVALAQHPRNHVDGYP